MSTKSKNAKKETKDVKVNNKKFFIILGSVIAACIVVGVICGTLLFGKKSTTTEIKLKNGQKVSIKYDETKNIEYEEYNNGLVKLMIPKGWKVEIPPVDYIHYNFKVYNPEKPDYMFFFGIKFEGYMKSERARKWQNRYYPSTTFAKLPAIDPQTTEQFYKVWNQTVDFSNKEEMKYEYFRHINNFEVIENLGKDVLGGSILRAHFTNDNGDLNQGIFTATIKDVGGYKVSENITNIFGPQIDVWPLFVYNIIYMSAPDAEFINWQPILEKCLNTIEFSETFIDGFNKEEQSIMENFKANQRIYDEMSNMIMDSWEKRNNSYDIISQKQSDATLGYERVYDTETGEIYKAYNGFTDDYSGDRYKPITDDMYTKTTSGYIEK
jgi:hypothetical protein